MPVCGEPRQLGAADTQTTLPCHTTQLSTSSLPTGCDAQLDTNPLNRASPLHRYLPSAPVWVTIRTSSTVEGTGHLPKMVVFQSPSLVFDRGLPVAFFLAVTGSRLIGFVGAGTTAAGAGVTGGVEAVTCDALGDAFMPSPPSPTTTNGAQ
jgi:hypothetical protein